MSSQSFFDSLRRFLLACLCAVPASDVNPHKGQEPTTEKKVPLADTVPYAHGQAYAQATAILELIGNNNLAPIQGSATYIEEFGGIPADLPKATVKSLQIPVDEYGRPHNVIGRLVGNNNSAPVVDKATFKHSFMTSQGTTDDGKVVMEQISTRAQTAEMTLLR